ncbi:MAG: hypothetical protein FWC71_01600 [Defluviitaleaceae bacterium]|nr:hypothetical protein [Defluviitaleaceae bacterium]
MTPNLHALLHTFLLDVLNDYPLLSNRKSQINKHTDELITIGKSINPDEAVSSVEEVVDIAFLGVFETIGEIDRRLGFCDDLIDIFNITLNRLDAANTEFANADAVVNGISYFVAYMRINANKGKNYFLLNTWDKFKHIDQQKSEMESLHNEAKETISLANQNAQSIAIEIVKIQDTVNETEKMAKTTDDKVSNVLTQSITILSIFAVILMTFFSGLTIVDSFRILSYEMGTQSFIFILLITGHLLLMLIFMFMHFVSRLAEKPLGTECRNFDLEPRREHMYKGVASNRTPCSCCDKTCNSYERLKRKYPYLLYANIILFFVEIAILIWWFSEEALFRRHYIYTNNPILTTVFLIAFITLLLLMLLVLAYAYKNKDTKKLNWIWFIVLFFATLSCAFIFSFFINIGSIF